MTAFAPKKAAKGTNYQLSFMGSRGVNTNVEINDGGNITSIDDGIELITGHQSAELMGTSFYSAPLSDRQKQLEPLRLLSIGALSSPSQYKTSQARA